MAEKMEDSFHLQDHDLQSYTENLTNSLNKFRKDEIYCDIILVVGGKKIHAHKNILAASSPYFSKLFNQLQAKKKRRDKETSVIVNDISVKVMEDLLEYLYTGLVDLSTGNVEGLIKASNILLLPRLKDMGCKYLESSLNLENCIYRFAFGDGNDCSSLKETAQQFINKCFRSACKTESFVKLTLRQVEEIISSDDIVVDREEEIYEAVLVWIKQDVKARGGCFATLFRHVRLASVSKYYLHTNVGSEELVKTNRACIELLLEAMKHLSLMQTGNLATSPISPRKCLRKQIDAIIACGGLYENSDDSSCLCFVPCESTWYSLAPICKEKSARRWAHGMAELEGFLYVAGGFYDDTKQDATSAVSRYDLRTNTWVSVSRLRRCTALPAVTVHDGRLYIIGGSDNDALRETQRYSPETNTWELLAALSTGRCAPCAAADEQFVYVFGGMQESGDFLGTAEKYDPNSDTWSSIAALSTVRAFACAIAMGERIFVIGGSTDVLGKESLSSTEVYDTQTEEWSLLSSMSVPRFAAAATVLHERLYVFGGGHDSETFTSVECYSIVDNEWKMVGDMPRGMAHVKCSTVSIPKDLLKSLVRL